MHRLIWYVGNHEAYWFLVLHFIDLIFLGNNFCAAYAFSFDQVISDKQLVKHLQKEVARLEAELRTPEPSASSCSEALLKEKELKIKKV